MQYMLMCCIDEELWAKMPEAYHLVECQDLDEAIAIAGRVPTLRVGGSVEVRPVAPASER